VNPSTKIDVRQLIRVSGVGIDVCAADGAVQRVVLRADPSWRRVGSLGPLAR
jgi:hypothetical protein